MKKLFTLVTLFTLATVTSNFAQAGTDLKCISSGAEGSLVKTLDVTQSDAGLVVMVSSMMSPESGAVEVKIKKHIPRPTSDKYELEAEIGGKMNLVIYKKQAVILYEAGSEFGNNVEFLTCE